MKTAINEKGFTLSEIAIVIIIIGIMASVVLPRYPVVIEKMRSVEGINTLASVRAAQLRFYQENGAFQTGSGPSNELMPGDLDVDIPASKYFWAPFIYSAPINSTPCDTLVLMARLVDPSDGLSANLYSFEIDKEGNVWCTDGTVVYCARMGYDTGCP